MRIVEGAGRPAHSMRFLRQSLIGVFLLSVTVGLLALAANTVYGALQTRLAQEAPQPPARERLVAANVVTVAPETVTPVLEDLRGTQVAPDAGTSRGGGRERSSGSPDAFEEGGGWPRARRFCGSTPRMRVGAPTGAGGTGGGRGGLRDAERGLALARDELAAAEAQAELRAAGADAAAGPRRARRGVGGGGGDGGACHVGGRRRRCCRAGRRSPGRDAARSGGGPRSTAADRAGGGRAAAGGHRDRARSSRVCSSDVTSW